MPLNKTSKTIAMINVFFAITLPPLSFMFERLKQALLASFDYAIIQITLNFPVQQLYPVTK
jgi:hypothetical protein